MGEGRTAKLIWSSFLSRLLSVAFRKQGAALKDGSALILSSQALLFETRLISLSLISLSLFLLLFVSSWSVFVRVSPSSSCCSLSFRSLMNLLRTTRLRLLERFQFHTSSSSSHQLPRVLLRQSLSLMLRRLSLSHPVWPSPPDSSAPGHPSLLR